MKTLEINLIELTTKATITGSSLSKKNTSHRPFQNNHLFMLII